MILSIPIEVRDRITLLVHVLAVSPEPTITARLRDAWRNAFSSPYEGRRVSVDDAVRALPASAGEMLRRLEVICARSDLDFLTALEGADLVLELAHAVDDLRRGDAPINHPSTDSTPDADAAA